MAIIEDTAKLEKLDAVICEEEKAIEKCYTELGKAYFEKYGENCEGSFQAYTASIKGAKAKIEDCKAQIKELKGIIACPKCGKDVNKTDTFCVGCGTRIAPEPVAVAPAPVQTNKCAACGAVLDADSVFCTNCGTKVEAAAFVATPAVEDTTPKCAACGAALDADTVFCTNCGTKVEATPVVEKKVAEVQAPVKEEVVPAEDATPKCAVCGAVLDDGSVFCTMCGTKVTAPAAEVKEEVAPVEDTTPKCVVCGAVLDDGSVFCTMCGTKVTAVAEEKAAPVPVKEEVVVPAPTAVPAEEVFTPDEFIEETVAAPVTAEAPANNFCANCGKKLEADAKFCIYCGSKL